MVTFLTLFLGLTIGPKRVELAADHQVASLELRLDGQLVATLYREPWVATCDFGRALVPHRLEVIARDRAGRELDRAVQHVNLPRSEAEATLRLLGGEHGYSTAELSWKAVDETDPEEIRVFFDGAPLPREGRRVELPPHDLHAFHVLAAELVFPGEVHARVDVAFGGEYGEEISSELTAVPLELQPAGKPPSAQELESWLRVGGRPARVLAVEHGPREVVIVREETSLVELRKLRTRGASSGARRDEPLLERGRRELDARDTLRLVEPRPSWRPTEEGGWTAIFSVSQNLNSVRSGLGWTLTDISFVESPRRLEERLIEAVGVAGLHAAGSNRVRAVVLVRAADAADVTSETGLDPSNVRGFLRELRVPFFYWRVGRSVQPVADAWGDAARLRSWGGVNSAVADLVKALRAQFVVWIAGLHMPEEVVLAAEAPSELRLAGTAEPVGKGR